MDKFFTGAGVIVVGRNGACLYIALEMRQTPNMHNPSPDACLFQRQTFTITLMSLQATPTTVYAVAETFFRQFHPDQLMPTPVMHESASQPMLAGLQFTLPALPISPLDAEMMHIGTRDSVFV
mmetsp:Transcript_94438/g.266676  ORF Transcript_94438/g.266676 Transcript_94438/m.266676 type:complete len:123 (-) Transcript_94438:673-1041(-)